MDSKEFKEFVIQEAKKYLLPEKEQEQKETVKETISDDVSPEQIKILSEEIKKINKTLDLRNPLICEEENLVDTILESKKSEIESWKKLSEYNKFKDEELSL